MNNRNWGNPYGGWGWGQNQQAFQPKFCPPQIAPTQTAPAQVSPTQQYVKTNIANTIIPHIMPSHTTNVFKQYYHHKYYFPHTESCVNQCYETHTMCGCPYKPC
jgi:spore coat protein D